MILKVEPTRKINNFTMHADPAYKCMETFRGGFQWYLMEKKASVQISVLICKLEMEI